MVPVVAPSAMALLLLGVACAEVLTAASTSATPTNFVIMLMDDVGWGDWSRTGSHARTPNMEAMSRADHAVWFQRAYAGNPICSPTRASLHTGRTPARSCIYGVEQHILCRAGAGGCTGSEYSLANATKDFGKSRSNSSGGGSVHGRGGGGGGGGVEDAEQPAVVNYLSGFYGKWHLGSLSDRGVGSPDCYAKPANTSCCLLYTSPSPRDRG